MTNIYTMMKRSVLCAGLFLGSNAAFAQTPICGPVSESFDNTSGSTAGFTGSFTLATDGTDGQLQKDRVLASVVYTINTPTYQLAANTSSIGFGFLLNGSQRISRVEVKISYRNTITSEIVTTTLTNFVPAYSQGSLNADVCRAVSTSELKGFPAGGQYRLHIELTSNSGDGIVGETITFDDFRTNGTLSQAPLPVTFIGFEARKMNASALLTWKIADETNVNRYEVERSEDGRNFTRIGQIQSHGKDIYTFTDDAPLTNAYYRIRNVDNDGSFKYSTIARIVGGKSATVLRAFPQPVTSLLTLQHPAVEGKTLVSIATAEGRVVRSIQPATGSMQTNVDMSSLSKGLYFIRITGENGQTETLKIMKQ